MSAQVLEPGGKVRKPAWQARARRAGEGAKLLECASPSASASRRSAASARRRLPLWVPRYGCTSGTWGHAARSRVLNGVVPWAAENLRLGRRGAGPRAARLQPRPTGEGGGRGARDRSPQAAVCSAVFLRLPRLQDGLHRSRGHRPRNMCPGVPPRRVGADRDSTDELSEGSSLE